MAYYFGMIAIDLREILYAILINNYVKHRIKWVIIHFIWFSYNVFKFLLINYLCETVSNKAKATADLLNKLSHFTCDVEIHETFITSIAAVLVIIIQAQANK
ncbi:Uncharacterized protein DBV15_06536 [Temnothorax longispinosus]|uniref:Gustatory receptor n=1 Tax=Temnothorax longispinosus TaxID=300112 RepID=A0A4S2KEI3_9HYME|nr:Uncharacterized protein DBV15_06536 [Temnothorax longispinosus]